MDEPRTPYQEYLERQRRARQRPPVEPPIKDIMRPHHTAEEECPVCQGKGFIMVLHDLEG